MSELLTSYFVKIAKSMQTARMEDSINFVLLPCCRRDRRMIPVSTTLVHRRKRLTEYFMYRHNLSGSGLTAVVNRPTLFVYVAQRQKVTSGRKTDIYARDWANWIIALNGCVCMHDAFVLMNRKTPYNDFRVMQIIEVLSMKTAQKETST